MIPPRFSIVRKFQANFSDMTHRNLVERRREGAGFAVDYQFNRGFYPGVSFSMIPASTPCPWVKAPHAGVV
jgi:hypothetical protein